MRELKNLGMLHCIFSGGYLETTPSGYIEGMASMMGVTHAIKPTTPGIRPRQPTEAEEKLVDETKQRVFRAIVGKAQWILRARLDVLYAVKEPSRRLQGPREVDHVAAKRMVKYLHGTRDTGLQLLPRKGTLRTALLTATGPDAPRRGSLGSHGVVEWCTRELTLQDTVTHCFVVTRSRVLRLHRGSCRGEVRSIRPS